MNIKRTRKNRLKRCIQVRRNIVACFLILIVFGVLGSTASATLSVVKPQDAAYQIKKGSAQGDIVAQSQTPKSRAPEPTTMALFGGGIFGMLARFVRRSYMTFKRIFDIIVSVIALIFLSPLCVITAALIKVTSKGPIFFTQTRVGKSGELFEIYKFRTMRVDAEKATGPVWAAANDNRLIFCGKFLRKTHIDEIPQFLNVLRGEMSVIGPRPERPVFVDQFKAVISDYEKRIAIKPGITGMAQVWHKYDESIQDVRKKVKYDLLYIRKVCLWTDFNILLRTIRVVLTGEGAR